MTSLSSASLLGTGSPTSAAGGIEFAHAHGVYMRRAIHSGTAKNDNVDALTTAGLLWV
jgi:hypothetical protein